MQLSENFTLGEFLRSETAARLGIDNTPSDEIINALRRNAANMEGVRSSINLIEKVLVERRRKFI